MAGGNGGAHREWTAQGHDAGGEHRSNRALPQDAVPTWIRGRDGQHTEALLVGLQRIQ